jgi:AraC-like DNA-binding protein
VTAAGFAAAVLGRAGPRAGVLCAASAGLLWAASDPTIKALSGRPRADSLFSIVVSPLGLLVLLLSLAGLLVSARSLQIGPVVPVIAVTSVAANSLTIAAGPIVFSEPMPEDTLGLVLRSLAFALVICAAALTPPPLLEEEPAAKIYQVARRTGFTSAKQLSMAFGQEFGQSPREYQRAKIC